jgi:hypothetical protein
MGRWKNATRGVRGGKGDELVSLGVAKLEGSTLDGVGTVMVFDPTGRRK